MMVRCPQCSVPQDVPLRGGGDGATLVHCRDCGHEWIEGRAFAVVDLPLSPPPVLPDVSADQIAEAARLAKGQFAASRRLRRIRAAAWTALLLVAVLPLMTLVLLPEKVVAAVPASIRFYDWIERDVNIYGLEIQDVEVQFLSVSGKKVIAVKGRLANIAARERKIPWLRFGLRSNDNVEVYHWTLNTEARPLRAGESTSFTTRLASPPPAAGRLEIRFARASEIGSNAEHERTDY